MLSFTRRFHQRERPDWGLNQTLVDKGEMLMTGTTVKQLFQDSDVNAQKVASRYEIPPPDTSVKT
jgi:versiconal hemiacetal acetate esterase